MSLNTKNVYQLDNEGYFLGTTESYESPLEPGKYHIPANSILIAPPLMKENEIAFWDGTEWTTKPDYSEKTYYHKQTQERKKFKQGEEFDSNYTHQIPLQNEKFQKFTSTWVVDEEEKINHIQTLNRGMRDKLLAATDKYFLLDIEIESGLKEKYAKYRQYLRDYTKKEEWHISEPFIFETWNQGRLT